MARARLSIATTEPTRYEVALYQNGALVEVLGYSERKGRAPLIGYAVSNGEKLRARATDADRDCDGAYSAAEGFTIGSLAVRFTGRTERDAAI